MLSPILEILLSGIMLEICLSSTSGPKLGPHGLGLMLLYWVLLSPNGYFLLLNLRTARVIAEWIYHTGAFSMFCFHVFLVQLVYN